MISLLAHTLICYLSATFPLKLRILIQNEAIQSVVPKLLISVSSHIILMESMPKINYAQLCKQQKSLFALLNGITTYDKSNLLAVSLDLFHL